MLLKKRMKFYSKIIVTIINSVETCPGRTPKDHMDGKEGGGGGGGEATKDVQAILSRLISIKNQLQMEIMTF